jgi:hypothetical protein
MESLKNIVSDIRVFLYGGIATLPLTIAGTLSILGLFTGNYAIIFFLLGFLILTPIAATLLNLIGGILFGNFNIFKAKTGDSCKLVVPFSTIGSVRNDSKGEEKPVISSSWLAMTTFFIGYIFTNSLELYSRETDDTVLNVTTQSASDLNTMVTNRKSQAIVAMASIVFFALVVLAFRYYTGCESILGMIITTVAFVFLGNGWYKALSNVGEDRLSDLFGIANRLLPPSAINNAPIACIPVPSSS